MNSTPPPLTPQNPTPRWLLVILWGLPAICVLLMTPFALYWAYVTKGEKMVLIFSVFGVIYLALLAVLAEINGRIKASAIPEKGPDVTKVRLRHSALYFMSQLILAPVFAFCTIWLLALLR